MPPIKSWANDQDSIDKKQLRRLIITESVLFGAGMTALAYSWYGKEEKQSFHLFNDNKQWQQMDKIGHVFTSYHLANVNALALHKTGMSQNKAYLWSGVSSSLLMLSIEIFDGFSPNYGASWGDALANSIGAFLPVQALLWNETYIFPKYSFRPSPFAALRPQILGKGLQEEWLKDYNGQTYWLSLNIGKFDKSETLPEFLALSLGYGAEQMVYGNPTENISNGYQSYRQLYLSLDIDFSVINTNNKWLKALLYGLNMIKIPLPTLEYSNKEVKFHPIYF